MSPSQNGQHRMPSVALARLDRKEPQEHGEVAVRDLAEQKVAALGAEEHSYRNRWQRSSTSEDERNAAFCVARVLREYVEAVRAAAKARQLVELPPEQWRSGSPLSNARTAARRCGDILSGFTDEVAQLLDELPGAAADR